MTHRDRPRQNGCSVLFNSAAADFFLGERSKCRLEQGSEPGISLGKIGSDSNDGP